MDNNIASVILTTKNLKSFSRFIKKKELAGAAGATTIAAIAKVPRNKLLRVSGVVFAKDKVSGEYAAYTLIAHVANKAGTVALVGAVTVVSSVEEDATWAATLVANDTTGKKSIDLQVTPDGTNATIFWGDFTVIEA